MVSGDHAVRTPMERPLNCSTCRAHPAVSPAHIWIDGRFATFCHPDLETGTTCYDRAAAVERGRYAGLGGRRETVVSSENGALGYGSN